MTNYIYIMVMAGVTILLRILPMTLMRRPITNSYLKSFLYYVPYVSLALMTFPAIIEATQVPAAGAAAMIFGIILAWLGAGLFPVAISCCAVVFLLELLII